MLCLIDYIMNVCFELVFRTYWQLPPCCFSTVQEVVAPGLPYYCKRLSNS